MWQLKYERLALWDVVYAVDLAIVCLVTYWIMASLVPRLVEETSIGALWAVISAVFVFRDTRAHSLSAATARLIATFVSVVLCLSYLWLFPFTPFGMAVLLVVGTLVMMLLGRRDDIGLTAITTAVVMIVAAISPQDAWHQPWLRFMDTAIGIAVGVACKWVASSLFYRITGRQPR